MPSPTHQPTQQSRPVQQLREELSSIADLAISPLSLSAPAPSCVCTSNWQHSYFNCKSNATPLITTREDSYDLSWIKRHDLWSTWLRSSTFTLDDLEKQPTPSPLHALYHALHAPPPILLTYLTQFNASIRDTWATLTEDKKREQEDMVLGEMTLINRVVEFLLRKEGEWEWKWSEEERGALERCVFDLRCVRLREKGEGQGQGEGEGGGVEGEPVCGYCDPEEGRCEECEGRERAEKDRHDSGVGIEGDQIAMKSAETQNAGENRKQREADSSIDDEEGGVRLDIFFEEVRVTDANTSEEEEGHDGHATLSDEKERFYVGDETNGKQEETGYAANEEEVPQATKYAVSDRDFGLAIGREHMQYDSD